MVALLVFYAKLDWVAGPGRIDFFYDGIVEPVTGVIMIDAAMAGEWDVFKNALSHAILPASMLAIYSLAYIARMTRSFMLDQLNQEYVLTARVKGLREGTVIWYHAFRNVLVQLITIIGLTYASLLEGSVLTETVFAWPGMGKLIIDAIYQQDTPLIIACFLLFAVVVTLGNLFADLAYAVVDPRIRHT